MRLLLVFACALLLAFGALNVQAQVTITPVLTAGYGAAADRFGSALTPIGDLDGNSFGDYAVGASGFNLEAGQVRLLFMSSATTVGSTVTLAPAGVLDADRFGASIAVLSTSPLRLLVGAPGTYDGATNSTTPAKGAVYVLTISSAGAITATDVINDLDVPTLAEDDRFGSSVAVLTGGRLLVGAPGVNCTAGVDCGAVYVLTYTTPVAATVGVIGGAGATGVTTAVSGLAAGDAFGAAVASAPTAAPQAVFVGAPGADVTGAANSGRVYRTSISAVNAVGAFTTFDRTSGAAITTADPSSTIDAGDRLGASLATPYAGTGFNSGAVDVLAGAPGASIAAGRVWLLDVNATSNAFQASQRTSPGSVAGSENGASVAYPNAATGYTGVDVAAGSPGGVSGSGGVGRITLSSLSGTVLPVELTALDARVMGSEVEVTWTTQSEQNNAGFGVEYRTAANLWQEAVFVEGQGTTTEAHAYRATVAGLVPGAYSFRLRQVDLDGAFHYSAEVSAQVGLAAAVLLRVSPNPVTAGTRVAVAVREAQPVRVALFDALGREVAVLFDGALEAAETVSLPLAAGLSAGTYVVRVSGARDHAAQPIVVTR